MKLKIKEKITIENILCLFIILCPILDMISFIFRNIFYTNISPSTLIRPIIPMIVIMYIFFRDKIKLKILGVIGIYAIYAIIHLLVFNYLKTGSSYSGIIHELQYIINYSFMILNLFVYYYVFKNKSTEKLKNSIVISISIYIISIFISIITNTSSTTYIEGLGKKGWFESGNSISSIFILSMFILCGMIKEKKYRYWIIGLVALVGIYLTTLIGTRVGLFGFILVLFIFSVTEITSAIFRKEQLNKWILIGSICSIIIIVVGVGIFGSTTLQRRKHLQSIESNIVDKSNNKESHISGSLLEIKEKIDKNHVDDTYMSHAAKMSIQDLYEFANKHKVVNNDMRTQQLVYNMYLIKNQANPIYIFFGNGYMTNYRELVLEMEIPALLFNFGVVGFILYLIPFLIISLYGIYIAIKLRELINNQYLMILCGCLFSFVLSFLSGYTFFNSSTMMIIIVLNILLLKQISEIKSEYKK